MLTVIVLAEENAEVEPSMVQKTVAINQQAASLANIARQLAGKNYKDFPEIGNDIVNAANSVDEATHIMTRGIQELSTCKDRVTGWNGLLDACRIMSGKTILLLQIIYGADVHRLLQASDRLKDKIRDVKTADLNSTPVTFRDTGKEAATFTNQFASYLQQQVTNMESPLAKQKLDEYAKGMSAHAQKYIGLINYGLQDTTNQSKHLEIEDYMKNLICEVDEIKQFIKDNSPEVPTADLDGTNVTRKSVTDRIGNRRKKSGDHAFIPANRAQLSLQDYVESPLSQKIDETKQYVDKIKFGAASKDSNEFVQNAKDAQQLLNEIKSLMDEEEDEKRRENNDRIKKKLEKAFPQYILAGKALLVDPDNTECYRILDETSEAIKDLLDEAEEATKALTIDENLFKLRIKGDDILSKRERDAFKNSLEELVRGLNRIGDIIKKQGENLARAEEDQRKRKQMYDALDDLGYSVKELSDNSQADSNIEDTRECNDKMKAQIDNFRGLLQGVQAIDAIRKLQAVSATLIHDAKRGDKENFDHDCDELKRIKDDAIEKLRNYTDTGDDTRPNLQMINDRLKVAELLDAAIENEIIAAKHLMADPKNPRKLVNLKNCEEDSLNYLAEAKDILGVPKGGNKNSAISAPAEQAKKIIVDIKNSSKDNPVPHILEAKKPIAELREQARKLISETDDPLKKKKIETSLDSVEAGFTGLVRAVQAANKSPDDHALEEDLEKKTRNLISSIDALVAVTEDTLDDNLNKIIAVSSKLPTAKRQGDKKAVANYVSELNALKDATKKQVHELIAQTNDPVKKEQLRNLLKDLEVAVKDSENDVNKNADWVEVNKDCDEIRRAANALKKAGNTVTLSNLDAVEKSAKNLVNAADAQDPNWEAVGNQLREEAKKLVESVKSEAKNIEDPHQKRKALKVCEELEDLVDAEFFAANDVIGNSNNPKTKKALEDSYDKLHKALKDIDNAFKNKPIDDGDVQKYKHDDADSEFKRDVERAKAKIKEIVQAAENENPSLVVPTANKLKEALEDLGNKSNKYINDEDNNRKRRNDTVDNVNRFDDSFKPFIDAVKSHLQNPKSLEAKKALQDAADQVEKVLNDFADSTKKNNFYDNLEAMKVLLDQLDHAKKNNQQEEVEKLVKKINDLHDHARTQGEFLVLQNQNPKQKKALKHALEDLNDLVKSIDDNSKHRNSSSKEMTDDISYAKKKIDDIIAQSNAKPLGDIEHVDRAHKVALHAGEIGNDQAMKKAAANTRDRVQELLDSAAFASKQPHIDPAQRKKIEMAMDDVARVAKRFNDEIERNNIPQAKILSNELENSLNNLSNALKNASGDSISVNVKAYNDISSESSSEEEEEENIVINLQLPTNYSKASLPDDCSPLERDLEKIKTTAQNIRELVKKKQPVGVAVAAQDGKKELDNLIEKVKKIQDETTNPERKRDIEDALKRVERLFPQQLNSAKNALENPDDEQAKKDIHDDTEKLLAALTDLENVTRPPTLYENLCALKNIDNDIIKGKNVNPNDVTKIATTAKQQAEYDADTPNTKHKMAIYNATGGLKKAQNDVVMTISKPNSSDAEKANATRELDRAIEKLENESNAKALDALQKLSLYANSVNEAGKVNDVEAVKDQTRKLNNKGDELVALAEAVAKKVQSTNPTQADMIRRALAELPHAIKNANIASKNNIENPNDPTSKVLLDEAFGQLNDVIIDLENALKNKTDAVPRSKILLDNQSGSINLIIPILDSDIAKARENDRDPNLKRNLLNDNKKLGIQLNIVEKGLREDPNDEVLYMDKTMKGHVKDIMDAAEENNQPKYNAALKALQNDLPEYKAAVEKVAQQKPEAVTGSRQAIADLERAIPFLVDSGKDASRSQDIDKKIAFHDDAKKVYRAIDRATKKATPPQDEVVVRDVAALIKDRVAKAREARRLNGINSNTSAPMSEDEFKIARKNLGRAAERRAQYKPNQDYNASAVDSELDNLWKKFGAKRNALANDQNNSGIEKELSEIEDEIVNKVNHVNQATAAQKIAPIREIEIALDSIIGAADSGDIQRIKPELQNLNNKVKQAVVSYGEGPELAGLEPLVKSIIYKTSALSQDFENPDKFQELKEEVERAKQPLAEAIRKIDPESKDRNVHVELQKAKVAIADLNEATRKGDVNEVNKAIEKAKTQAQVASKLTKDLADSDPNNKQRENLAKAAAELDNAIDKVVKPSSHQQLNHVRYSTGKVEDAVDFVIETMRGDVKDDLQNSVANAQNKQQIISDTHKSMKPKELTENASNLSENAKNVVNNMNAVSSQIANSTAKPISTTVPRNVTKQSDVAQSIQSAPVQKKETPPINEVIDNLNNIAYPKPKPQPKAEPKLSEKKATDTFEETAEKVAEDIAAKALEVDCSTAHDISFHLNNVAKHARSGERKEMLQEAKNASIKLNELCKMLRERASSIQGKTQQEKLIQDRLLRSAQALQNYGTQLKILTSVKASSLTVDKDNDQTLSSIVLGIGNQINEGLTSLDITDRTINRKK